MTDVAVPTNAVDETRARPSTSFRLGAAWQSRLWPAALIIGVLALAAVLLNGGGRYIIDNHDALQRRPGLLLSRQTYLWDSSGGLGRANEESWVVLSALFSVLRGVGLSAAMAERVFHALLLTTAGVGAVALVRQFRPRMGAAHLIAGLLFAFNPWTASTLLPSILFVPYALAPWFLVVFLRGVREAAPWRWAAAFALLTFVAGTADLPGLTFGLVPLVPCVLYVIYVERTAGWVRVIGWFARAALLTVGVFVAGLFRVTHGATALADRLGTTEDPRFLNANSSWSETWRGLGFWGAYFRTAQGLVKPQTAQFYGSAEIVLATFVAPCAALVALWRSRWRPRLLFAAMALISMALMVGSYPPKDASPYGRLLLFGYDTSLFLWGWRNNYKAGPGWALGVAVLAGLAVAALLGRAHGRGRGAVAIVALGVFALASYPFWSNHLYAKDSQAVDAVPRYWTAAGRWLDARSDKGRVLVLPGTTRVQYRWGHYGENALRTRRPYLTATSFPPHTAQTADLVAAVDGLVNRGTLKGSVAPIARRLGVRYIVLQNDLDWKALERARPSEFDALRKDPQLRRVAVFGGAGQNVVDAKENSLAVLYEAKVHPVEIFEVLRPPASDTLRQGPPLVVSGDGSSWPAMARAGALDGAGPVMYSAASTAGDITDALRRGGRTVVTDTNRRRLTVATSTSEHSSYTLAAGTDLERPANPLFTEKPTQSVATYGAARDIRASSYGPVLGGGSIWQRPSNAFDGDPRTAWRVGGLGTGVGAWIEVTLTRPLRVSSLGILDSPLPDGGRHVSRATIEFSSGAPVHVRLPRGLADVHFSPRTITSFRVRIDELTGKGDDTVGFAELSLPGVDLGERIRLPEDLVAMAGASPSLRQALLDAPMEFQFERSRSIELHDEELVLRRRFRSLGARQYDLSGSLRTWDDTPDEVVAALVGGPRPTFGSSRAGGMENRGGQAVDGDVATAWNGDAKVGETLTSRFPEQPVTSARIAVAVDPAHSLITRMRIRVGDSTSTVAVPSRDDCPKDGTCVVTVDVPTDGSSAESMVIEATDVQPRGGFFGNEPIAIAEVTINGAAGTPLDRTRPLEGCAGYLVALDGEDVPLQLDGTVDDILELKPVTFRGCTGPVALRGGVHDLDGAPSLLLDELRLSSGRPAVVRPHAVRDALHVLAPGSTRLRVNGRKGDVVLSGQSYDPDWRAWADGRALGRPVAVDTQSGWVLPRDATTVTMRYTPQRQYQRLLAASLLFIVLCGYLVVRRRPRASST